MADLQMPQISDRYSVCSLTHESLNEYSEWTLHKNKTEHWALPYENEPLLQIKQKTTTWL